MSRILLANLHQEADRTWPADRNKVKNWSEWCSHWVKSSRDYANSFREQGLESTAVFLHDHIDKCEKVLDDGNKRDEDAKKYAEARANGSYVGMDHNLRLRMIGIDFQYEGFKVRYSTSEEDWKTWWKSLGRDVRKELALQVEMAFGREAYQKA